MVAARPCNVFVVLWRVRNSLTIIIIIIIASWNLRVSIAVSQMTHPSIAATYHGQNKITDFWLCGDNPETHPLIY